MMSKIVCTLWGPIVPFVIFSAQSKSSLKPFGPVDRDNAKMKSVIVY